MALLTRAELEALVLKNGATFKADEQPMADAVIAGADAQIKRYLGRNIEEQNNIIEYFSPDDYTEKLFLSEYPVTNVVVIEDSDRVWGGAALVEDDDYLVFGDTGILERLNSYWLSGSKVVQVDYTGGYAVGSIPPDIKFAMEIQCKFYYDRRNDIDLESVSFEGVSADIRSKYGLLPGVKEILNKYRSFKVG